MGRQGYVMRLSRPRVSTTPCRGACLASAAGHTLSITRVTHVGHVRFVIRWSTSEARARLRLEPPDVVDLLKQLADEA